MIGFFEQLCDVPGAAHSKVVWEKAFGERFPLIEPLLKPTGRTASSVPCENSRVNGCMFRMVEHDRADLVGVCDQGVCDDRAFRRSDVTIYRLDGKTLGERIRDSLGLRTSLHTCAIPCWSPVGDFEPVVGHRFPVFLVSAPMTTFQTDILRTVDSFTKPPAIIWLSPRIVDSSVAQRVDYCGGMNILADDVLRLDPEGFVPSGAAPDVFLELVENNVEEPEKCKIRHYPLPPNTIWEDITIRFQDEESVTIKCGRKPQPVLFTFRDFGFGSQRSTSPKKTWGVLKLFAKGHGELIPPEPFNPKGAGAKQKEFLSKAIREVFQLSEEPLPWDSEIYGWKARFKIFPIGWKG